MNEIFETDPLLIEESIEDWVITKCDDWRDSYEANYSERFDEYYRLWRGIWDAADSSRVSERSRIIAPALQQAVESNVAELEEATFGRGKWFDVSDNVGDKERQDVMFLRQKLSEDFENSQVRKAVAECLLNAAVFGTAIGELIIQDVKEMVPAKQPIMGGDLQAVGVNIKEKVEVKLKAILPQNFLIDPMATSIEDAQGVAIDEFVSLHQIEMLQEEGVYRDVHVGTAPPDTDLEPDQDLTMYNDNKVRLTKYYGLVPRQLLEDATEEEIDEDEEEVVEIEGDAEGDEEEKNKGKSRYVEAIVVIANGGVLLKAEANPYMMQDRPVVAFPWDIVPGRFWGRGVCEKGYNSQKALDTELRARIDALSLTVHPMLAVDATRLPRGAKPEIRPGKIILTSGDPREVLQPFNFGQVDQITFAQAAALQQMVQQATGAVDSAGIAGQVNGEATAAGISMSLGAIIKRHKRTLINFQQSFLIPFVKKAAYRYMQFDPENYPVADYKFNASSTLGIMAREYEVTQLVQLLQTMQKDSPLYNTLIQSIIENMNLSNREELVAALQQAMEPNPQATQAQEAMQQAQLQFQQSQTAALSAQAQESSARATKLAAEALVVPQEAEISRINAVTRNLSAGDGDDRECERRMRVADTLLKQQEIRGKTNANRQRTTEPPKQRQPAPPTPMDSFRSAGTPDQGVN
jgi:hypothetical protein